MPLGSPQSLITRCPGCATAFRASAEQLSLRHGLVRCGRCSHVFDARAHAVEVDAAAATSTPTAGAESPPMPFKEESADEPIYDATSFIVADDEQLPSEAAASDDQANELPTADRTQAASDELPGEVTQRDESPAIEAAAEPGDDSTDTAHAGIEEQKHGDGGAVVEEEPIRPFAGAEVLDEARSELSDAHGAVDQASATSIDEVPQEETADGASEVPDEPPATSAETAADADTAPLVEHSADGGKDATEAMATDVSVDKTAADVPDDRFDPIDAAVAAMPPAIDSPRPGITSTASTVAPLELEFGAPRRARPGVPGWLGIPGAILLVAALAGQVAYHLRGDLILLFPSFRQAAVQLCDWAGCDLPSPQRAELMSIEASDLQADSINPAVMVLSATLRNRAPFAQAQPALELTLTDSQDQPVARRVIGASDYVIAGIQNGVFPASSELPVKIYFEASAVKATGYRLYLFYP